MDRLLKAEEVAELLGAKVSTIYAWVHEKYIPHYKINKLVRFSEKEIFSWLKEKHKSGKRKRLEIRLSRR